MVKKMNMTSRIVERTVTISEILKGM